MLRSAAIRNVHDVVMALGLGANGVCPYVMVEVICVEDYDTDVSNLCAALRKGIEKVISTIGIHEVRGYARQFSSIGVKPELAEIFQTETFAASERGGVGFSDLDPTRTSASRSCAGEDDAKPAKTFRFYPKVYKAAIAAANGTADYEEYSEKVRDARAREPDLDAPHHGPASPIATRSSPAAVDASVGHHDYPIVISSMSFGSQSEPAFRAYAEAAKAINILCINGEGGEIQDMYGQLPQVARAAGRLGPLRRLGRDAQLLVPGRDQDRAGREAGRGRPPAGPEGLREGRRGAQRHARAPT